MKKIIKKVLCTVLALAVVYGAYVGIDCARLSKKSHEKTSSPIIEISKQTTDNENENKTVTYYGPGYNVKYHTGTDGKVYGAEFRFLNKLVWAWIE